MGWRELCLLDGVYYWACWCYENSFVQTLSKQGLRKAVIAPVLVLEKASADR